MLRGRLGVRLCPAASSSSSSTTAGMLPPKSKNETANRYERMCEYLGSRDPNHKFLFPPSMELYRWKMSATFVLAGLFMIYGVVQDQLKNPGSLPTIRHDGRSMVT